MTGRKIRAGKEGEEQDRKGRKSKERVGAR